MGKPKARMPTESPKFVRGSTVPQSRSKSARKKILSTAKKLRTVTIDQKIFFVEELIAKKVNISEVMQSTGCGKSTIQGRMASLLTDVSSRKTIKMGGLLANSVRNFSFQSLFHLPFPWKHLRATAVALLAQTIKHLESFQAMGLGVLF